MPKGRALKLKPQLIVASHFVAKRLTNEKLKQYNLTEDVVKAMIQGSNLQFPLGLYTFGNIQQSVIVDVQVTTAEDLSNLEIPYSPIPSAGGSVNSMGNIGAVGAQQSATASPDAVQMQMPAKKALGERSTSVWEEWAAATLSFMYTV